jgi:hypothetical protein
VDHPKGVLRWYSPALTANKRLGWKVTEEKSFITFGPGVELKSVEKLDI